MKKLLFALALVGCIDQEPEPSPPDAAPAVEVEVIDLLQCVDCEYGWVCDVHTGWRCWAGTQEPCAPHPDDPVCEL